MISKETHDLLLSKDPKYTYCNLSSNLLTDADLEKLADLVALNPHITHIDLAYNPDITLAGFTQLQKRLPNVKILNCSCFLTLDEAMEQFTASKRIPGVPFSAIFSHPSKLSLAPSTSEDLVLTDNQLSTSCTLK